TCGTRSRGWIRLRRSRAAWQAAVPTTDDIARQHHQERAQLAAATAAAGVRLWQQVDFGDLTGSWSDLLKRAVTILSGAQLSAARPANEYANSVLSAQGLDVDPRGKVRPDAFSGVASDGRSLASLLQSPVAATKTMVQRGYPQEKALATGQSTLEMMLRTQVSAAGRVADGVAVAAR